MKIELLEVLGEIFETPHRVIPSRVFNPVKRDFENHILSPLDFLGELKKMLNKDSSNS